ncbi:hypothetical protein IFM89_039057 [Coptis chinensis]|uniref:Uncharacterized protein n=1 Tax=Coptis chinensis TaxID=261450 RepID=A0A835ILK1_9MAGN|nr:hypothetical protein IFM89_039057 [Coptis chinensis]
MITTSPLVVLWISGIDTSTVPFTKANAFRALGDGDFVMLLNVASDEKILPATYGELRPPLGKHHLKDVFETEDSHGNSGFAFN